MKITVTDGDDWKGLYVDGKLVYEGHSIPIHEFAKAANIDFDFVEADDEWLEEVGSFPKNLSEVKK